MTSAGQSARLLPLEGGRNFRDLGGYPADGGRQVRWGRLFRSGAMHRLTDADYQHLGTLGIKVVYDLRSTLERKEAPTDWRASPAAEYLCRDYESASSALSMLSEIGDRATSDVVRDLMTRAYVQMPTLHREAFRGLFARLVKADVPLVFNCSAGKDRTGVAAALVLSALGVRREIILEDYALSETYVDYLAEFARDQGRNTGHGVEASSLSRFMKLPREALQTLMRSDPCYLEAMLAELDKSHGGVVPYLEAELGVGRAEVNLLKETLLESAR
jgi:protein-tyrosine phosphatase